MGACQQDDPSGRHGASEPYPSGTSTVAPQPEADHALPSALPLPGRPWTLAQLIEARCRVARGVLVYRPEEVAAMLLAEADSSERGIASRSAGAEQAGLRSAAVSDALGLARLQVEELRAAAVRVAALPVGDVIGARALARDLSDAAYYLRRRERTPAALAHAAALERGASLVRQYLEPWFIEWELPALANDICSRAIVTRVLDGALDVRVASSHDQPTGGASSPCLSREELRRLVVVTDAAPPHQQAWRSAPGPGVGPGVLLFQPEEVAEMLEAEARLCAQAAEALLATSEQQGHGARFRRLAKDLTGAIWRVRRLATADVPGAVALLERLRHECRTTERRKAHGLWENDIAHLEIIAAFVQAYLVPMRINPDVSMTVGVSPEYEVHQRWVGGAADLREVALAER